MVVMTEIDSSGIACAPHSALAPLRGMLHRRDPVGVLSVYVDGRQAATPADAAVRQVRIELDKLVKGLAKSQGRDVVRVADAARHEIVEALDKPTGGSFVLFVGLNDGERHRQPLLSPGVSRVSLGPRPDVRQMCRALQMARPAGVVLLDGNGARVLEWIGELEELWVGALPELEEPDLVGPAHGHVRDLPGSAPGFTVSQQRDLFERRMASEYERFLNTAAASQVSSFATNRQWFDLVVCGEGESPGMLVAGLAPPVPVVIPSPHLELWRSLGQLSGDIGALVTAHRALREAVLVDQIREEARLGSVGLGPVLESLREARVRALLVPAEEALGGLSSADASVLAESGALPPGVDPQGAEEDGMLADAMIARALDTGADVVALSSAGSAALGDLGAAAIVRW
jgi:hypothetical protein